jgi:hypothetical protein
MSNKFHSPGQIRKRNIKRGCIVFALVCLSLAYFVPGPAQLAAIELQQNHESAPITITNVNEVEEESRGRRGRKKISTMIYIDYQYQAEGETFSNQKKLSASDFLAFKDISVPQVWFKPGEAAKAKLAGQVKADATRTPVQRMFSVGMIVLPVLYVLNIILSFFFGREPKGYLPEGFYTDSSWLDIEDNYLITLEEQNINIVSFDKKSAKTIQSRYQNGSSLDEIVRDISVKQSIIPIDSITSIESDHFRDTIYIEYKINDEEESKSLEFLSATVKAHALEKLSSLLPTNLVRTDKQFSRFGATKWRLMFAVTFAAIAVYYADMAVVLVLSVLASLYLVKSSLARLIDPTLRSQWVVKESA